MTNGQTVFVTGASSGIGRATALELARRGHRVLIGARRTAVLDEIAQVDPNSGRVSLRLPGLTHEAAQEGAVLAVEVSTKPLINLVWLGAILMVGSVFLSMARRAIDLGRA